jgi:predicted anti-sigma-YlaC factor YlaD
MRRRLLEETLEAPVSAPISRDIADHLRDCRDCAEAASRQREVADRLRSLPRHAAPADLGDRIFAASQARSALRRPEHRRRFLRFVTVSVPLAAAAAVALVVWLGEERPRRPEIVIVEVPFEEMQKTSPFSPALLGKAIRKAQG